jgi:hypothetical protein
MAAVPTAAGSSTRNECSSRARAEGRPRTVVVCIGSSLTVLAAAIFAACEVPSDAFLCGVPVSSGSTTIRVCDRAGQVCICADHSCADTVPTSVCASGLKYDDAPFARDDVKNTCASADAAKTAIIQTSSPTACTVPATTPAPGGTP